MIDAHRRAQALHHPRRRRRAQQPDRRVLPVGARARAVPAVLLLHQVRLLHGGVPDLRDRPGYSGPMPLGPGAPLQRRHARRRVHAAQGGCSRRARAVALPLRRRVLAGVPEGRRPGQGDPAHEAGAGARLPAAAAKQPCPATLARTPVGIKRRDGIPDAPPRATIGAASVESGRPGSRVSQLDRVRLDCARPRSATGASPVLREQQLSGGDDDRRRTGPPAAGLPAIPASTRSGRGASAAACPAAPAGRAGGIRMGAGCAPSKTNGLRADRTRAAAAEASISRSIDARRSASPAPTGRPAVAALRASAAGTGREGDGSGLTRPRPPRRRPAAVPARSPRHRHHPSMGPGRAQRRAGRCAMIRRAP